MTKTNLPVILLKGIVLLPHNDIKLEFKKDDSGIIVEEAEYFHNNKILIVCEPSIDSDEKKLPEIGIIAKLSHKIELPNGRIRVTVSGVQRAHVVSYLNPSFKDEVLEAIITTAEEETINKKEEAVLVAKIKKEVSNHVSKISYLSNSIMGLIDEIDSLSKITDIVAMTLSVELDRLMEYLTCLNPKTRTEMLIKDLYVEEEEYNIEKELDIKVKSVIDETQKEFFLREKLKIIKEELGDISPKDDEIDEIRERLKNLEAPTNIKEKIENEIKKYEVLSNASPEINLVRNYIEWLLDLPWEIYTNDNENLKDVKNILNETHYGLEKVKTRIIEFLAVKKMTNSLKGPILCLVGPPGVGKTSLAFSIAKAMNRKFVKISVGGVSDEAEIKGHRRTYLGANPGRIITSIKKAKSANPVFLIDEIDKMTKDLKGDPASALLEVLDPEQNFLFSDNYIEEEFDLSQVLFITTANYIEQIPEALKDRLEVIKISGYTEYEKVDIVKKHLLPKICKEHGVSYKKVSMKDEIILKIIRNYTKEAGVRELERQVAKIIRKVVTKMVVDDIKLEKIIIDEKEIDEYLGKPKYINYNKRNNNQVGVVNGLAYTQFGGDTLPIEVTYYKGEGKLKITGSLGDVMKESAELAFSYVKSNYKKFNIDYELLKNNDFHIHAPEGATPKDGPSAGITLTTAIISALNKMVVNDAIAMTGEITLRGKVLPIGGLKEKSLGALRNGIQKIIIPEDNLSDLDELPQEVKDNIEFITVKQYEEVYKYVSEK